MRGPVIHKPRSIPRIVASLTWTIPRVPMDVRIVLFLGCSFRLQAFSGAANGWRARRPASGKQFSGHAVLAAI